VLLLPFLKLESNPLLGQKLNLHLFDPLHYNLRKSIPSHQNGDTAVIMAVERYIPATLRELVRAGSDLNLQNNEGLTPLMIAARSWRIDITDITNILLEGEHFNLDYQEKGAGWSALHFFAERGDLATTEALLKAGANPH
ncbi:Putative ankyrin repeat protein MM_0045, partial [Geodia barretti]